MGFLGDPGGLFGFLDALPEDAEVFGGMDVACTRDFSVLSLGVREGSSLRGLATVRIRGARLPAQKAMLRPILRDRRLRLVLIDSSGIGLGLTQDMEDEFPGRVEGVNFATTEPITRRLRENGRKAPTARVTEIMATEFAAAHDDHRVTYWADATMKDDLRKPHRITDARGRVSIAAESTATGHADHFWAPALCWRAAFREPAWTFAPEAVEPDAGATPADAWSRTLGARDESNTRRLF